uniref:SFRICE_028496 n=1 Tax=Spodoptera frugiperda TaxID=7108 RepID=A0A2H1WT03_SPOFR
MSSIPRHTTRRLSRCYWRFEDRAHRALCLESRVLSGARDDVGSLDSLAGGYLGVGFDYRVDATTVLHTALTVSHSITRSKHYVKQSAPPPVLPVYVALYARTATLSPRHAHTSRTAPKRNNITVNHNITVVIISLYLGTIGH